MAPQQPPITPYKTLPVYPSEALRVLYGANEGDGFGYADDLMLDDVYVLASDAHSVGLALAQKSGATIVASGSELGTAGAKIHLHQFISHVEFIAGGLDSRRAHFRTPIERVSHGGTIKNDPPFDDIITATPI